VSTEENVAFACWTRRKNSSFASFSGVPGLGSRRFQNSSQSASRSSRSRLLQLRDLAARADVAGHLHEIVIAGREREPALVHLEGDLPLHGAAVTPQLRDELVPAQRERSEIGSISNGVRREPAAISNVSDAFSWPSRRARARR